MRFLLYTGFLLFLFSCGSPKEEAPVTRHDTVKPIVRPKDPVKAGVVMAVALVKGTQTPYDDEVGRLGDSLVICSYKGRVDITDTLRKYRRRLFDIKAEFMVDKIYISPLGQGKYFAHWQETDHEGVKCYSAVFDQRNPKPEWKVRYTVPNPGQPAIDSGYAYVTTLGMAGKIRLADGTFAWKHDSLFSTATLSYQKFEPAKVYNDRVIFVDYPVPGRRERRDTLKVEPRTGARLR